MYQFFNLQHLSDILPQLVFILPLVLISLSIHEYAHGWMAYHLGDMTAKEQGRLRLNPLAHLDPIGTLMLVISMTQGFGIGWAKPVPIDPRNFRSPRKGMVWVSLAGPVSNLLVAVILGVGLRLIGLQALINGNLAAVALLVGIRMNIGLALFNLIPIPPLDGSRFLLYFLRGRALEFWINLEKYGFMILLGIIIIYPSFIDKLIGVPYNILFKVITGFLF